MSGPRLKHDGPASCFLLACICVLAGCGGDGSGYAPLPSPLVILGEEGSLSIYPGQSDVYDAYKLSDQYRLWDNQTLQASYGTLNEEQVRKLQACVTQEIADELHVHREPPNSGKGPDCTADGGYIISIVDGDSCVIPSKVPPGTARDCVEYFASVYNRMMGKP